MLPLARTSPGDCECGGCCDTSLPPVVSDSLVSEAPQLQSMVEEPVLLLAILGVALVVTVRLRQRARQVERTLML